MALTRLSAGVYRNEQGKTVYSKDGKTVDSKKKADPKANKKRTTGKQLEQTTTNMAGEQLAGSGLGTAFELGDDTSGRVGVDSATTSRLADEAFARVDKDITRREQDERGQLQAELANRGININNPEDPTYKRFMQDLERKFTNERDQAQQSATAQATQTQIGLAGIGLAERQNTVAETAGERNQRMAEIEWLIKQAQEARRNGFTQQELDINKKIADLRARGGGGTTTTPNVFNNGLPPSAGR